MLYCTKCSRICDNEQSICPSCKRGTRLRSAKEDDMVYFLKTTEFESEEIDEIFSEHGIKFEIRPYKTGIISNVYDSSYMPSDKVIFVKYSDLDPAKEIMQKLIDAKDEEELTPTPTKKQLVKQTAFIVAFLGLVTIVVLLSDVIANFLRELFT